MIIILISARILITTTLGRKFHGIFKSSYLPPISDFVWTNSTCSYWRQRYQLFSRYDDGVLLTDDAWFGVTPEAVAKSVFSFPPELQGLGLNVCSKIAEHMSDSAPKGKSVLIDAFAGVGGNTIAFARSGHWKRVYAIEKNPTNLKCAKRNAEVYGVQDQITWFEGDCFEILKKQLKGLAPFSVIFASPPWGGVYYSNVALWMIQDY